MTSFLCSPIKTPNTLERISILFQAIDEGNPRVCLEVETVWIKIETKFLDKAHREFLASQAERWAVLSSFLSEIDLTKMLITK